jgi:hypothetical protein
VVHANSGCSWHVWGGTQARQVKATCEVQHAPHKINATQRHAPTPPPHTHTTLSPHGAGCTGYTGR